VSASPEVRHLVVPRTARYATVGDARGARELWMVLHGYGQLAERFVRHFAAWAPGRLVAAPEALSRFYLGDSPTHGADARVGATWMTREDRLAEIADYVRYLDLVHADVAERVGDGVPLHVLAFSQGTATACRWLQQGAATAGRLILWGGGVPLDLELGADDGFLRRTRLTLVRGTRDEFATDAAVAEQETRLRDHGIAFESVTFDGGHQLDAETLGRVMA
jgi:predicted esterase